MNRCGWLHELLAETAAQNPRPCTRVLATPVNRTCAAHFPHGSLPHPRIVRLLRALLLAMYVGSVPYGRMYVHTYIYIHVCRHNVLQVSLLRPLQRIFSQIAVRRITRHRGAEVLLPFPGSSKRDRPRKHERGTSDCSSPGVIGDHGCHGMRGGPENEGEKRINWRDNEKHQGGRGVVELDVDQSRVLSRMFRFECLLPLVICSVRLMPYPVFCRN
ncbi:hypothetical protein L209DRAFT_11249 [Thermothelomyces heterothallicus CBS 203.75]